MCFWRVRLGALRGSSLRKGECFVCVADPIPCISSATRDADDRRVGRYKPDPSTGTCRMMGDFEPKRIAVWGRKFQEHCKKRQKMGPPSSETIRRGELSAFLHKVHYHPLPGEFQTIRKSFKASTRVR